jgi:transcriptional regulator GlxA family with amidase domain
MRQFRQRITGNTLSREKMPRTTPQRASALASRQRAVQAAEAYLRAHPDVHVPVSKLCRVVGLSERGLRNAFYTVRGMSPARYMRAQRLQNVRDAMRGNTRGTVTEIATGHGFYELGRFSMVYRAEFGESPSETLRRFTRARGAVARETSPRSLSQA